jgi:hypothetical protein
MNNPVIIYKQNTGVPAVVIPTPEALDAYGIVAIAAKDVPAGKPFKILDASELPLDVPQEAWVIDEADLTDGVGGESNEFPPQEDDEEGDDE